MGRDRRRVINDGGSARVTLRTVGVRFAEYRRRQPSADKTHQCRGEDDQRKRNVQRKNSDKGRGGDGGVGPILRRARAGAVRRVQRDRGHGGFDAIKNPRHHRDISPDEVDPRQRDEQHQRGQDKQHPGDDASPGFMHQPADIGRQLLSLRARQDHTKVERVQESPFRDPASVIHQLLVHHGDLPGRPAEADEAELQPEANCLPEGDGSDDGRAVTLRKNDRFAHDYQTSFHRTSVSRRTASRLPPAVGHRP
ncbi:Uncharacterised protein [Klebsiella pneumoniae]|nr:Uncharacterised protein [Klebsiella pneumoniae]